MLFTGMSASGHLPVSGDLDPPAGSRAHRMPKVYNYKLNFPILALITFSGVDAASVLARAFKASWTVGAPQRAGVPAARLSHCQSISESQPAARGPL
jgi:hypothetical protein